MKATFARTLPVVLALAFGAVGISAVAQTTAPATAEPSTTEKVKEAGKDAYDATKDTTKRAVNATERGAEKAWDATKRTTKKAANATESGACLLYTSPSPRDLSTSRMPSSA